MIKNLCIFAIVALVVGCSNEKAYKKRFFRMSTVTDATVYLKNHWFTSKKQALQVEQTFAQMDSIMADWEKRFSMNEGSEIFAVNNRKSGTVVVTQELYNILDTALAFGDSTDGYFDVTVQPLKAFWQPECVECVEPTSDQESTKQFIAQILPHINYKHIKLVPKTQTVIFLDPKVTIDVGGIAKGFVLHRLQTLLDSQGYKNYLVSIGGDIIFKGCKPHGKPFVVGVQAPRSDDTLLATFAVDSRSVITSGDYERFRITPNGERVHHLFNPKTGYSATANMSVTILMDDPLQGILWCKVLFVKPALEAIEFARKKGFDALVVDSMGNEFRTAGFPKRN